MATENQASAVPVQKFSRYRSVRIPKSSAPTCPPPTIHASSTVTEPVKRSLSRYRSNRPADRAVSPPKLSSPATTQQKQVREGTNEVSARRETRDALPVGEKEPLRAQDSEKDRSGRGLTEHGRRHEQKQPIVEEARVSGLSREGVAGDVNTPASAINAGERKVRVKYNQASVFVPVAPSTTTTDMIRSVAEQLSESIDIAGTVVLECIPQLGLERPLRDYEHIRDVLNSWNVDSQNHLIIVPSSLGGFPCTVAFGNAAREQPGEKRAYVYHSHQPGKWDKRWVTLRSDGQVLLAKKDGGKTTNICHISDFDVYVPTRRQIRKLGPPHKTCYAIKSQQKSSMFLTTANYLHFFAFDNAGMAADWYNAVHEWRSWYLVTVLGKGYDKPVKLVNSNQVGHKQRIPNERPMHCSADLAPAAVYSLNKERDNRNRVRRPPPITTDEVSTKGAINVSPIACQHGPSTSRDAPSREKSEDTFAATGLLGQTYEQRQKAQRERDTACAHEGPFLPGLLLRDTSPAAKHHSSNGERWQHQGGPMAEDDSKMAGGLKRRLSKWQKSAPLVDLTSFYKTLPRSRGEGRGVLPEHLPAGGLIDLATTGPQNSSRPGTSSEESVGSHRGSRPGSKGSLSRDGGRNGGNHEGQAYIAGGLLAKAGIGQGGTGKGRGVRTGDRRAKEPMLDMSEPSKYAPGSLLAQVERQMGEERAVRDRMGGREVWMPMGDGV